MRRWIAITMLLAFTALAVFGFVGMVHGDLHAGCIAVVANPGTCPSDLTPSAEIAFHLETWKGFSAAVAPSLLLLAVAILVGDGVGARGVGMMLASRVTLHHPAIIPPPDTPRVLAFSHWLALHERRDPALVTP